MKRYTYLLFLFLLTAGSVSAQFRQKPGDPVDYSRIIRPHLPGSHPITYTGYGGERPFTFSKMNKGMQVLRAYQSGKDVTMDDVQRFNQWAKSQSIELFFNGDLLRTRDLTDKDLEEAIQYALRRMSWTRADVQTANIWLSKIRTVNYSAEDFWNDMKTVLGVAGTAISFGTGGIVGLNPLDPSVNDIILQVVGLGGDMTAAINSQQYAQEWKDQTEDYLHGIAASGGTYVAFDFVKSTVFNFRDFGIAMQKADARQKQLMMNLVAETYEKKLEQFYLWINYALPKQRGEIWMIYVQGSAVEDLNFEEVLCQQTWNIYMELKNGYDDVWKDADPKAYEAGYEGVYMGMMDAHLEFNFTNYDASFVPNTQDHVWTALTASDIRGIGLQWKINQMRLGGSFQHIGMKTRSFAQHQLPVLMEIKRSNKDSKEIRVYPKIVERDMLKQTVPGLLQKKSESSFFTNQTYTYNVSGDGFTYDGSAAMYSKGDSTLVVYAKQNLQTPRGQNAIEAVALAVIRAMMFVDGEEEHSSDYSFRKETYPIGLVEIDLQTSSEDETGVVRFF